MANFISTQLTPPKYPVSGPGIGGRSLHTMRAEVALTSAAALNDTIQFFDLPPRFRVTGGFLKATDLDTGGPTITLDVGDADDTDRYFAASTAGQAGTVDRTLAATGVDFITTKKTRVTGLVKAAATTPAAGTVTLVLYGTIEEPA